MNIKTDIQEIKENEFEEKVLTESSSSLVLVDFWAPWCGPCKQLTPILEKVIPKTKGRVKLVKINIDENQQIAAQLRIQSIPAVFAFKDGQPIDAFQGVMPENKIVEFIEKALGEKIEKDHSDFYKSILELFSQKNFDNAKSKLEDFITENPSEYRGFALFIESLISLKNYEEAQDFIKSLSKEYLENKLINSSIEKLSIIIKNKGGPSVDEILEDLKNNPKNIDLVLLLAEKYFAENMIDEAFNLLLENFSKNKEKTKQKMLKFFDALGNQDEKTIAYRKKLSSKLFS